MANWVLLRLTRSIGLAAILALLAACSLTNSRQTLAPPSELNALPEQLAALTQAQHLTAEQVEQLASNQQQLFGLMESLRSSVDNLAVIQPEPELPAQPSIEPVVRSANAPSSDSGKLTVGRLEWL